MTGRSCWCPWRPEEGYLGQDSSGCDCCLRAARAVLTAVGKWNEKHCRNCEKENIFDCPCRAVAICAYSANLEEEISVLFDDLRRIVEQAANGAEEVSAAEAVSGRTASGHGHLPPGQVSGGRESTIGASAASTTGTAPAQAAEPAERRHFYPEQFTVMLSAYEVANLRAAILACGYLPPYPPTDSPRETSSLSALNTGDWLGQIYNKLPVTTHPPNKTPDQMATDALAHVSQALLDAARDLKDWAANPKSHPPVGIWLNPSDVMRACAERLETRANEKEER